jgi:predicted porin
MNKKLIAVALSTVIAGIASAQTANVVLYGRVDAVIENVRTTGGTGVSTSVNAISDGSNSGLSGSRWGLRGTEALGGGLNAVFLLESGFNVDNGSTKTVPTGTSTSSATTAAMFSRQAYAGLNGGFGSVTFGRQYAPIFYVADSLDSPAHDLSAQSAVGAFLKFSRINNSVIYSTPAMGGVSASLLYAFGESTVGNSANRHVGANLQYSAGPLYAGLGYHQENGATGARAGRSVNLGIGYDFGMARPSLMYQEHTNATGVKFKSYVLTADVKFGAVTVEPQYGEEKNSANNGKTKRANLTASYDLSKRTTTYASIYNTKATGANITPGFQKQNVFLLGFRNKF